VLDASAFSLTKAPELYTTKRLKATKAVNLRNQLGES